MPALQSLKSSLLSTTFNPTAGRRGRRSGSGAAAPGAIGLIFNVPVITSGSTLSNSNTTITNTTGGVIASAKSTSTTALNVIANYYWEFTVGVAGSARLGIGASTFVCDTANQVGNVANSVAYSTLGFIFAGASNLGGAVTATTGDVIGFKLDLGTSTASLTLLKNGVVFLNSLDISAYLNTNSIAWGPVWSSGAPNVSATISNNIYEYAGYTPIGSAVTTVGASASVTPVADGKYDVYTFNASGTFTTTSTGAVRALVIAGGGGAFTNNAGGGGAGGYQEKGVVTTPQTYTVTVGGGGTSGPSNGSNSVFSTVTSLGGGKAGGNGAEAAIGGSGGGAGPDFPGPTSFAGGIGTNGQGNAGGNAGSWGLNTDPWAGGGGGGAGGVGGNGNQATGVGGNGGAGLASDITGVSVTRAGGGAGSGRTTNGTSSGGGGRIGLAATANTGGGSGPEGAASSGGGSGVVIIRVRARA